MLNEKLAISATESVVLEDLEIDVPIKEDDSQLLSLHISSLAHLQQHTHKKELASKFILSKGELLPALNNSINKAILRYKKKTDAFSNSPTFLIRLANLLGAAGKLDEEETILRDAIKISPITMALDELGENLLNQGKVGEAINTFSSSNSLHANLRLVYTAVAEGNFKLASEHLSNALAIDEFDYASHLLLGTIHFHNGDFHRAIRSFRVARETRPDSPTIFTHLGAAYYAIGENKKAIKELRKSLALNPANLGAQILHADILLELKQAEAAIPHLLLFLEYEANSQQILSRLANAYYETGRFRECLGILNSQLPYKENKDAGILNNIALCYWNLGQRKRAEDIFNLALNVSKETGSHLPSTLSNYLLFLSQELRHKDISDITEKFLNSINQLPEDDRFRDSIVLNRIGALSRIHGSEAQSLSETLAWLDNEYISLEFRTKLLSHLLYYYSMVEENLDKALEIARDALKLANKVDEVSDEYRATVFNNIMYVFLLTNDHPSTKAVLPHVAPLVHKLAVPTATFGMYHLLRDNIERGTALYNEAIRLSSNPDISYQIDNKMSLELAKYYVRHNDIKSARKHLKMLSKRTKLLPVIEREANKLIKEIATTQQ